MSATTRGISYQGDSATLYATIRKTDDGTVWDGSALSTWANGSIASYDLALTAKSGDLYTLTVPTALTARAWYRAMYYEQAGATPAITDLLLATEEFYWTGSSIADDAGSEYSAIAGRYITGADISAKFGIENVKKWSQLDNTVTTASTARITDAITHAEDTIDNYFRDSRYAVPLVFSSGAATLTDWAATIAGVWLYGNRGQQDDNNQYADMMAAVMNDMAAYKGGVKRMNATLAFAEMPTAPIVV